MEIISRAAAQAKGLLKYFTGKECRYGHLSERYVSCKRCIGCSEKFTSGNHETENLRLRIWRKAHAEKEYLRVRAWEAAHPEKVNAKYSRYKKNNKDIVNKCNTHRRARKSRAEGFYSLEDTRNLIAAQDGKCAYCLTTLSFNNRKAHLDHRIPLSKGGANWPKNLQWLCQSCNIRKSNRDPISYEKSIGLSI
jgi:5-methylcytosine-specific restriction endonuclease McrA